MKNDDRERATLRRVAALLVLIVMPVLAMRAQDRLPPIPPEKMSEAQKKAVADYRDLDHEHCQKPASRGRKPATDASS